MKPCKAEYSHIDEEEFAEGKIITSSLLKRYCQNIAALRKATEELEEQKTAESRTTYSPPDINTQNSYGITITPYPQHLNGYTFDNTTEKTIRNNIKEKTIIIGPFKPYQDTRNVYTLKLEQNKIQKLEENYNITYTLQDNIQQVVENSGTYHIDNENNLYIHTNDDKAIDKVIITVTIPTFEDYFDLKHTTAQIDKDKVTLPYTTDQYNPETADQANKIDQREYELEDYWNIGWNEKTNFWTTKQYIEDPFNENPTTPPIPTTIRAFTIQPTKDGLLTKVQIKLQVPKEAEDHLYWELRTTDEKGYPTSTILRRTQIKFHNTKTIIKNQNLNFNPPLPVKKGDKYAIVLRSTFTNNTHAYGIGGWIQIPSDARNIDQNIFQSEDNGHTWTRENSWSILGQIPPKAYQYTTYLKPSQKEVFTYSIGECYVYWKPIRTNPMQSIQLIPDQNYGEHITWQISTDMRNWHTLNNWQHTFEPSEQYRTLLYIRAILKHKKTEDSIPELKGLTILIKTIPATEAYLQTKFHYPTLINPHDPLPWTQIGTQIEKDDTIKVKVDLISETINKEEHEVTLEKNPIQLRNSPANPLLKVTMYPPALKHLQILEKTRTTPKLEGNIVEKLKEDNNQLEAIHESLSQKTIDNAQEEKSKVDGMIDSTKEILEKLIQKIGSDSDLETMKKELEEKKKAVAERIEHIQNNCSYLITVNSILISYIKNQTFSKEMIPDLLIGEKRTLELTENKDYTIDYNNRKLTLLNKWMTGTLQIEYHPIILKNINPEELPYLLNRITEEIPANHDINTEIFALKAQPITPLKIEYKNTEGKWIHISEENYTISSPFTTIKLNKTFKSAIKYKITYTPHIPNKGLSLAYHIKRTNPTEQIKIKNCYYQNKT